MSPILQVHPVDVVVLGAGVSGLVTAISLRREGYSVALVDTFDHLGGNHLSRDIGAYSFDIGSFLFDSRDILFKLFPSAASNCTVADIKIARLTPAGRVERYPYNVKAELFGRGVWYTAACLLSAAVGRIRFARWTSAADYAKYYIGAKIFRDSGLDTYIERLFGAPASSIDAAFAVKRLTWIPNAVSLKRRLKKGKLSPPGHGQRLVRPRGGFRDMYDAVRTDLESEGVSVHLGVHLQTVHCHAGVSTVATSAGPFQAKRVISTIPIKILADMMKIATADVPLESRELLTLYYSFRGRRGFQEQILYNFCLEGSWKRITMHSDYYGKADDREYFSLETALNGGDADVSRTDREFRTLVEKYSLLHGDLRLEGHDNTAFAYPVYSARATQRVEELVQLLADKGIETIGRQGRFDYIPTADKAARSALSLLRDRQAGQLSHS